MSWQDVEGACQSMSLFSSKQIVDVRIENLKVNKDGSAILQRICEHISPDTLLLISANKLDAATQKSKWVQAIDKVGVVVQIRPITTAQLPQWIAQRAQRKKLGISSQACQFIADKVEGNLLAAAQELEKLYLYCGEGDLDDNTIYSTVIDSSRFDVYAVVDAALNGDMHRALKTLHHIRGEGIEPPIALWALHRDIQGLYELALAKQERRNLADVFKKNRIWPQRQALFTGVLGRVNVAQALGLLKDCHRTDTMIKGVEKADPWLLLESMIARLCGSRVLS